MIQGISDYFMGIRKESIFPSWSKLDHASQGFIYCLPLGQLRV